MSSIDPIRRAQRLRRAARAEAERAEDDAAPAVGLPVPTQAARAAPPRDDPPSGAAAFDAQLLGQAGERRGLRAGAPLIEGAARSYNRAEWSGSRDRRTPRGRIAKTDI